MREGKELILATKIYAKEDRKRSWLHTIVSFLLLIVCYTGAVYPSSLYFQAIFGILAGLLLARTFIIYHDFLHHTIFQGSIFAKGLFTLFGYHMLAPTSIWKRSHDHHHNHNSKIFSSSIGSFPIMSKKQFFASSKAERTNYLFIRHPLTIAFGYIFSFAYGMCLLSLARSPKKHWDSAVALLFHYGCAFTIYHYFGWPSTLVGFLLPSFIAGAMGSYLFYCQHNFPGVTFKDSSEWTYHEAALNSSSFMKVNPVMNWFTGNIGYHHIHHINARIPFYKLPQVYKEMPEFHHAKKTSLWPRDIAKCLKLKVWDAELNRMIGMKELYSTKKTNKQKRTRELVSN